MKTQSTSTIVPILERTSILYGKWREDGSKSQKFNDIAALGVSHFERLYKEQDKDNIVEIVKMTSYFPSHVDEEVNQNLMAKVTNKELKNLLNSF